MRSAPRWRSAGASPRCTRTRAGRLSRATVAYLLDARAAPSLRPCPKVTRSERVSATTLGASASFVNVAVPRLIEQLPAREVEPEGLVRPEEILRDSDRHPARARRQCGVQDRPVPEW